jgi:hypothetical protein
MFISRFNEAVERTISVVSSARGKGDAYAMSIEFSLPDANLEPSLSA